MNITDEMIKAAKMAAPRFWQDTENFDKHLRKIITAALSLAPQVKETPPPQTHVDPAKTFAEWLNSGPAIAKAAGIEVEISAITSQGGTLKLSSAGYPENPPPAPRVSALEGNGHE